MKAIVDSHMHLWDYDSGHYPWLKNRLPGSDKMIGNYDPIRKNYFVKDYTESFSLCPVKKSVHIQVFGYPENPVLETQWLQSQADQFGFPHAIVGFADFTANNIEKILKEHSTYKNMRGIRNVLCHHKDPDLCMIEDKNIMRNVQWQEGLSLLRQHNLSLDIQIFDHQLDDLVEVANKFKKLKIIINHLAWPTDFSSEGFSNWVSRIKTVASCPNVFMKISGFGCVFKSTSDKKIAPYLKKCLEIFGIDRCIWGSNFPVDGLFIAYKDLVDISVSVLKELSTEEKDKLFYLNAERFYRI